MSYSISTLLIRSLECSVKTTPRIDAWPSTRSSTKARCNYYHDGVHCGRDEIHRIAVAYRPLHCLSGKGRRHPI
jgi:hypothetical protein